MKLATLDNGTRDGRLVVVSRDLRWAAPVDARFPTLQAALEHWEAALPPLQALYEDLNTGHAVGAFAFVPSEARAPLPRSYQWLDASAFPSHGALMSKAFNLPHPESDRPLMYQGLSHRFLGPGEEVPFLSEADGIDFEGEFAVITDDVPMGVSPEEAMSHIKLLAQVNDWSLRVIAPVEMKTGFGWIRAKPACAMAPIVLTPDELDTAWSNGRIHLTLGVYWNGERFGAAHAGQMEFGFQDLIAHAASTRDLCAGTVIGSGTVSNANYLEVGSSCIAERRGSEIVRFGAPQTGFMAFGDRVRMEAQAPDGSTPFGAIDQHVVRVAGVR